MTLINVIVDLKDVIR